MMRLTKFSSLSVRKNILKVTYNRVLLYNIIILLLFLLISSSCKKPTYPKENLIIYAQKLLKKEGNLDGKLKVIGTTMYLQVDLPQQEIITDEKKILTKTINKIEKAALILTRLALSTDANIEFIVCIIKAREEDLCIVIINYLQDIKDYIYMKISRGSYEKRIIFEIVPYSKLFIKEINLEEFLGRLLASNYNMFVRSNPFVGPLLSETILEFSKIENDTLIFYSNITKDFKFKKLFERLIVKYYLDIKKHYNRFFSQILILNRYDKEVLIINL